MDAIAKKSHLQGEADRLTEIEQARLVELEGVVEEGIDGFVRVGEALAEIRDSRLYRSDFATFAAYLSSRWHLTKSHAYRLIDSAESVGPIEAQNEMSPMGDKVPVPKNERQARPLTQLDTPAEKAEAMAEAAKIAPKDKAGKPKLTERVIRQGVAKVKAKRAGAAAPAPAADAPPWAGFETAVRELMTELRRVGRRMGEILDADAGEKRLKCGWARGYSYLGTIGQVNQLVRTLEHGLPAKRSNKSPGYLTVGEVARDKAYAASRTAKGGK